MAHLGHHSYKRRLTIPKIFLFCRCQYIQKPKDVFTEPLYKFCSKLLFKALKIMIYKFLGLEFLKVTFSYSNSKFVEVRQPCFYIGRILKNVLCIARNLVYAYGIIWVCEASTISDKNYGNSQYFHEKVLKNVRLAQRYLESSLPSGSMLCQVWKSYATQ